MKTNEIIELAKKWEKNPSNLEKYVEVLSDLQLSIFREDDPKVFGQKLITYLIMEYTLYNITEEDYCYKEDTDKVFKSLATALIDIHNGHPIKLPKSYEKYFIEFKKAVWKNPLYTEEVTLPQHDNIKVQKTDAFRGENRVSTSTSSFLLNMDFLFSNPLTLDKIMEKADKTIELIKGDFNKFCFIEKRKGPVGSPLAMGLFVQRYKIPAVIYRPRHLNPLACISGGELFPEDKLCLVYDISFSGDGLKEAAEQIRKGVGSETKHALVIADLQDKAEENLKSVHVTLHSLYKISEAEVKNQWAKQYPKSNSH